jgi:hypothetical protein
MWLGGQIIFPITNTESNNAANISYYSQHECGLADKSDFQNTNTESNKAANISHTISIMKVLECITKRLREENSTAPPTSRIRNVTFMTQSFAANIHDRKRPNRID